MLGVLSSINEISITAFEHLVGVRLLYMNYLLKILYTPSYMYSLCFKKSLYLIDASIVDAGAGMSFHVIHIAR